MREIDVFWLTEHVARELDVACAVKHYLEKYYGASMVIRPYNSWDLQAIADNRNEFLPRVVVFPYGYGVEDGAIRDYMPEWSQAIFVNASWEQLFYKAVAKAKGPRDEFSRQHIFHHAWGGFHKEFLMRAGVPGDHVFVNGHPAYRLYEAPYNRLYPSRLELAEMFGLDPERKWLFFPENYGWLFYRPSMVETMARFSGDPEMPLSLRDFCRKSLETVLHWLESVALLDSAEVILRPRPFTSRSDFVMFVRRVLKRVPERLHITKEQSVREWILASDVVMSSYSTSLIEASLAGKPVFVAAPIPFPWRLHADWHATLPRVTTRDEFVSAFLGTADNEGGRALAAWARDTLLGPRDPIFSLAGYLHRLTLPGAVGPPAVPTEMIRLATELRPPNDNRKGLILKMRKTMMIRTRFKLLWYWLSGLSDFRLTPEPRERLDTFDDEEVERRVSKLAHTLQDYNPEAGFRNSVGPLA